jgi:hypothetical protein
LVAHRQILLRELGVTGIEIAVGYLFAWAVRKAHRVGGRVDAEVDQVLDAGMDRLHELVSGKLGEDPALHKLSEEAEAGKDRPSNRTGDRVRLALEEAAEEDPRFAGALEGLVEELRALDRPAGATAGSVNNTIRGGTHYAPVLQGRDFSHTSFVQSPAAGPSASTGDEAEAGKG